MKLYTEIQRDLYNNITDRYVILNYKLETELEKAKFIINKIYEYTGCKFYYAGVDLGKEDELIAGWKDRDELQDIKDAYRDAKKEWSNKNETCKNSPRMG